MKAALLFGINDLRVVDLDMPLPEKNHILVKIRACAVCPTDVRKYRTGNHSALKFPENVGHEWAGDVIQVGAGVSGIDVGMRVAGTARGGYAEYLMYDTMSPRPQAMVPIPQQLTYEQATFIEPVADCLHSLRDQGQVTSGTKVVILGAGQMGLLHVKVAKDIGAIVIVSEPMAERRSFADAWGANAVLDPKGGDVVNAVQYLTNGGADTVIVSVGIGPLVSQALGMIAPRGRVVLFAGFPNEASVTLDPNQIHYGEVSLVGSEWIGVAGAQRFDLYHEAISLISERRIPVDQLITKRFALDQIKEAFEAVENRQCLKAMIVPSDRKRIRAAT